MPLFKRRPADRHAVDVHGRNADADRHALAFFAAHADAFIELQIVAHHAHVFQGFRAVADQRGSAHGAGQLAVFDQIAFARREDEIAAGDIHLAAAECRAVEAARHRADDVRGIAFARQHKRIGHARHGDVLIAFAASVAGRRRLRDAAGKLVLQIAAQDAVFDQHILLRRHAFVIHVERTAAAADGAVVDHGAERARDLLADAAAERGDSFAIEIGFEAVAYGFVQQNAGPAGTEHDSHFAGRRFDGAELHDGLAGGFVREMLRRFFVQEKIERHASAAAGMALLRGAVGFARQHHDAHAGHGLAIEIQTALRWWRPAPGAAISA